MAEKITVLPYEPCRTLSARDNAQGRAAWYQSELMRLEAERLVQQHNDSLIPHSGNTND